MSSSPTRSSLFACTPGIAASAHPWSQRPARRETEQLAREAVVALLDGLYEFGFAVGQ